VKSFLDWSVEDFMKTNDNRAREIAARLTPAQRDAFARSNAHRLLPGLCMSAPDGVVRALANKGCGVRIRAGVLDLNPCGLAVARILAGEAVDRG
jgi:hypothetical protein